MLELDLLEKKEIRDENIDKIEVLEQVKKLLTLPRSELITIKGLCDYYNDTPVETIKSCCKNIKKKYMVMVLESIQNQILTESLCSTFRIYWWCLWYIYNNIIFM